jgi:hypothetical protein
MAAQTRLPSFVGKICQRREQQCETPRSIQTALQRRIKHSENQCRHQEHVGNIKNILKLTVQLNLSWPLPETWDDQTIDLKFYPSSGAQLSPKHQQPVWTEVHLKFKKKDGTKHCSWRKLPSTIRIVAIATRNSAPVIQRG